MQPDSFITEDYSFNTEHPSPPQEPYVELEHFSYHNSPFSGQSDLSDDFQPYNPSEYDLPGLNMLMFNDTDFSYMQAHHQSGAPYGDYSSPSDNGDETQRSRASSVSSQHLQSSDVAHTFEGLSFHSPAWNAEPLPGHKPQSPPRLLMPDSDNAPPTINAPDGDGEGTGGPRLHIVPATPVSGGGTGQTHAPPNPFTRGAATLGVISEPHAGTYNPNPAPPMNSQLSSQSLPASSSNIPFSQQPNNTLAADPATNYLFPSHSQRLRSKSDPPVPIWDDSALLTMDSNNETVNMHDVSPVNSPQPSNAHITASNNVYLTPDGLRRTRPDIRTGHHRSSRSDDFRLGPPGMLSVPGQQDFSGALGLNTGMTFPMGMQHQQFLSPQEPPVSISQQRHGHGHSQSLNNIFGQTPQTLPPAPAPARGHIRRASSGTRSERGASAGWNGWGPQDGTYGSHHGSNRGSPYPSPHASPRPAYDDLPKDDPLDGFPGSSVNAGGSSASLAVTKQNVTTVRTSKASISRRKQEATFECPVPGCGSTFTRSFNLKGHMRSHNEEKPFVCHWPGCGKGFARQHDCKRHEQLHTNFRPYTCEGCHKPFARMDALNRHLRSEGGAECSRILSANGNLPNGMSPPTDEASSAPRGRRNSRTPVTPSQLPATLPMTLPPQNQSMALVDPHHQSQLWGQVPKMENYHGVSDAWGMTVGNSGLGVAM